ncbi:MAG TPA: hypothetical protein VFL91_04225 [Thermomicrobiales bacterium]|nr:hypothetical protein [Thermomicrobiales bacterium]
MQINMVDHAKIPIEQVRPAIEDILKPVPIRDPEGKVDIRPPVAQTDRTRTSQGSSRDPWVAPCQFKETIAHPVAKLGGKHAAPPSASG